jgi:Lar family restriction alleviation protein
MSELKPCPFCGEKATLDYGVLPNRKHWFITCDCCGMMYQYTLSQRKYVKDGWNTRPIEDALNKRIAELEAEIDQLTSHSDIERQDDKSPNDTQTQTIVYGKEGQE